MTAKLRAHLQEIGLSFLRAFVATAALGNIINVNDVRGIKAFLSAAAVAGAAAALRTLQALLATQPASDTTNE